MDPMCLESLLAYGKIQSLSICSQTHILSQAFLSKKEFTWFLSSFYCCQTLAKHDALYAVALLQTMQK